jgi:universal stress protein A
MPTGKNVLVVSRSTTECRKALESGVSLAKYYGGQLFLIHALHDPFNVKGWNLPVPSLEKDRERLETETRRELEQMVDSVKTEGVSITSSIEYGPPDEAIRRVAQEQQVELIVMMSQELNRVEQFLFGHAEESLIRSLPASLLLVKPDA